MIHVMAPPDGLLQSDEAICDGFVPDEGVKVVYHPNTHYTFLQGFTCMTCGEHTLSDEEEHEN